MIRAAAGGVFFPVLRGACITPSIETIAPTTAFPHDQFLLSINWIQE